MIYVIFMFELWIWGKSEIWVVIYVLRDILDVCVILVCDYILSL